MGDDSWRDGYDAWKLATPPEYEVEEEKMPWCFMCGADAPDTPDAEPPYRCKACFAAVMMNEEDGEL